jgi:alkylation response protein AidB-like acyl-CoA dehydrogenase
MIDFEFDEQYDLIAHTAREFFAEHMPRSRVREVEASDLGYAPDLWKAMAELDWLGLAYPDAHGGADGTLYDLFAIYVEMGRSIAATPHLASSVIAGETLLAAGSDAQKDRLIPAMARGEQIVAPALVEADGRFVPEAVQLRAKEQGGGYRLEGAKILVPYAHEAGELLVTARTGKAPTDISLFLVDHEARGVDIERLGNTGGQPLFAVQFDDVEIASAAMVGEKNRAWRSLSPVLDRASLLQCAEIIGGGEVVLEMSVQYALDREQFGTPIGRFQAVQFLCSDIAIDLHLTNLLAKKAAWQMQTGRDYRRALAIANARSRDAAQHMVRQAHEVQAGHGFMEENDIQLFMRRAKNWEFNLGDVRDHRDAIVSALP